VVGFCYYCEPPSRTIPAGQWLILMFACCKTFVKPVRWLNCIVSEVQGRRRLCHGKTCLVMRLPIFILRLAVSDDRSDLPFSYPGYRNDHLILCCLMVTIPASSFGGPRFEFKSMDML
jgi:hypothetical protein